MTEITQSRKMAGVRRMPSAVAAAVVLLALGACGSTVPVDSGGTQAMGSDLGGAAASPVTGGEISGDSSAPGPAAAGTGPVISRPAGNPRAATADGSPLSVGFVVQDDNSGVAGSLGASNATNGDERSIVTALIRKVNASGGVGGRPVAPVFYTIASNRQASTPSDQFAQEECATFTQDHRVFAAVIGWHFTAGGILERCMAQRGGVTIDSTGSAARSAAFLSAVGSDYTINAPSLERAASRFVDGLRSQGYFSTGNRIGVVTTDDPSVRGAVDRVLVPGMRAAGGNVQDVRYLTPVRQTSDVGQLTSEQANAIVAFRSKSIEHVVFLVGTAFTFMQAANGQQYTPRYGLSTFDAPQALVQNGVPTSQVAGSVGIGWVPQVDVAPAGAADLGPGEPACRAVLGAAGITPQAGTTQTYVADAFCDGIFLLQAVLSQVTGRPTADAFAVAATAVTGFRPAVTFGTAIESSNHAGASWYRLLSFRTGCGCFRYSSERRSLR